MHIMAGNREEQDRWEHTRMIVYNIAKFGNSDPKKMPNTLKGFMEFEWDEDDVKDFKSAYERLRQKKKELKNKVA